MRIHVLNGDAMTETFAAAGIPGELVIWREAAIDGPLAADMSSPALREARAAWFERDLGVAADEYRRDFDRREQALAELVGRPEVELILWFERDLFCELHLLDLLGRAAGRAWQVAVVHPPSLAIDAAALRAHFDRRHSCSASELDQARAAWRALVGEDPREFQAFGSDSAWLAALLDDMRRDLRGCFADARGLTQFDAAVLGLLASGPSSPIAVFRELREHADTRGLGLGDLQVWQRLGALIERGLIHADEPLPRADRDAPIDRPSLRASEAGLAALAGEVSARASLRGRVGAASLASWQREGDRLVAA
ncbi:hypothetical protein ACNOYE_32165 [Nannocystaceae bacterium ST9]